MYFSLAGTESEAVHGHLLHPGDDSLGSRKWFFHYQRHWIWSSSPVQGRLSEFASWISRYWVLNPIFKSRPHPVAHTEKHTDLLWLTVFTYCDSSAGSWKDLLSSLKVCTGLFMGRTKNNHCFSSWSWVAGVSSYKVSQLVHFVRLICALLKKQGSLVSLIWCYLSAVSYSRSEEE